MKATSETSLRIKGKTIIDHNIRTQLCLTCNEYVLADALYQWLESGHTEFPLFIELHKIIGFEQTITHDIYVSLVEKGIIDEQRITNKWSQHFKVDESEFEALWKIYHTGSKAEAKEVYGRARKIATAEEIFTGATAYLKLKVINEQFLEHTRTWLNPKYKKWEDDYSLPTDKKDTVEPLPEQRNTIHP